MTAAHTALLKSHYRGDNAHSFACVRLFLHASTKVSCVGFMIWCPSGRLPHVVCFVFDQSIVASDNRLSYACILLFPTGTKVSRGVPVFSLAMTQYFVRNITRVCLPETICKIFVPSLFYPVQRTYVIARSNATWQSPGRVTAL